MFHLEQKKTLLLSVFFIVLIASFFRLYHLDQVPAGMSWDEAAIGYNGFGIRTVHRDEWLHVMPFSFQSFGDYKAPFAIYFNGIFTLLFGLNLFAIRLPFALTGILSIVGMSALIYLVFSHFLEKENKHDYAVHITIIFATIVFAFSPWVIFFSRASFESGMSLCWVIWGIVCLMFSLTKHKFQLLSQFAGFTLLATGMYTYHSAKIVIPLMLLLFLVSFKSAVRKRVKQFILGFVFMGLLLLPLFVDSICIKDVICGKGSERLSQVSIFSQKDLSSSQKVVVFFTNYAKHFSPSFLLFGETTTLRHGDGKWGVLYFTELFLIVGTIGWWLKNKIQKNNSAQFSSMTNILFFGVAWICIGFFPAAIGFEVPHANRALLGYPGFVILESVGIFLLFSAIASLLKTTNESPKKLLLLRSIVGFGLLVHILLIVTFLNRYFTQYKNDSAEAFNYGYQQVFEEILPEEKTYTKILFTSSYGQPYIYALLFKKVNPIWYNGGYLSNYEFTDKINEGDLIRENTLIVATPKEIPPSLADKLIISPSGEVRFVIVRSKN